ncbi:MAG: hypothetical protein M3N23_04565, partial [Pseudomonadota bacterium]|nr:hypothetical protein [Pseudomonadota bacterium]
MLPNSHSPVLRPLPRSQVLATHAPPHVDAVDRDSHERDFRHVFENLLPFTVGTSRSILNSAALAVHRNGVG